MNVSTSDTMSEAERTAAIARADRAEASLVPDPATWAYVSEVPCEPARDGCLHCGEASALTLHLGTGDDIRVCRPCFERGYQQNEDLTLSWEVVEPVPTSEAAALAAELFATGRYDAAGAVREAEAQLAALLAEAEAWDAAAQKQARVKALAARGPLGVEHKFDTLFLSDNSQWWDDGERIALEVPPAPYHTPELREVIASRLEARDRGDDPFAILVPAPEPPDGDPPPAAALPGPEMAEAVTEARSEALGLRGLWSYRGTAGELGELIARERVA
jgi:hypothetical protein